ncbi:hypothetical protein J6590_097385, partial [Homalodisca vitripennis]
METTTQNNICKPVMKSTKSIAVYFINTDISDVEEAYNLYTLPSWHLSQPVTEEEKKTYEFKKDVY